VKVSDLELSGLIKRAEEARERAYAPYSKFKVGAALQAKTGEIYAGCNIESSSYGLTICAERVALFKAISEGVRDFIRIVVTADTKEFCPPCGACRQVLADFAPELKVILLSSSGKTKETTIAELLPEAFGHDFLRHRETG